IGATRAAALDPHGRAAAERQRRHRPPGPQPVTMERQRAGDLRVETRRHRRDPHSPRLAQEPAGDLLRLKHQYTPARKAKPRGGDKPVVARADDDGIRVHAAAPMSMRRPRSRKTSRAALAPGAPMTPPPGWVEEPHM